MTSKKRDKEDEPEQAAMTPGGTDKGGSSMDLGDRSLDDRERDIERVAEAERQGLVPGGSAAEAEPIPSDVPNPKQDPGGDPPVQDAKAGVGADQFSAQAATRPTGSGAGGPGRSQEGPGTIGTYPLIGGFPADERDEHYRRAAEEQEAAYGQMLGAGSPKRNPLQPAPVAMPAAEGGNAAGPGSGPLGGS
jgi:hypothetical protein